MTSTRWWASHVVIVGITGFFIRHYLVQREFTLSLWEATIFVFGMLIGTAQVLALDIGPRIRDLKYILVSGIGSYLALVITILIGIQFGVFMVILAGINLLGSILVSQFTGSDTFVFLLRISITVAPYLGISIAVGLVTWALSIFQHAYLKRSISDKSSWFASNMLGGILATFSILIISFRSAPDEFFPIYRSSATSDFFATLVAASIFALITFRSGRHVITGIETFRMSSKSSQSSG